MGWYEWMGGKRWVGLLTVLEQKGLMEPSV